MHATNVSFKEDEWQCDQMARLFVQNLAISSGENFSTSITNLLKKVINFAKYLTNPYISAKYF